MKYFSMILLLFISVIYIFSCQNDNIIPIIPEEQGEPVDIHILAKGMLNSLNTVDHDDEIKSVRILAFHSGTGFLKFNSGKLDLNMNDLPLRIQIMTGTYDFVFIANEHSVTDNSLTSRLDQWQALTQKKLQHVDDEFFLFRAFDTSKEIPATSLYRNVRIIGNDELNYYDTETNLWITINGNNQVWEVNVERSGIRIDLNIMVDKTLSEDIKGIRFANVPDKVPFFEYKTIDNSQIYNESGYGITYPLCYISIDEFTKKDIDNDNMSEFKLERIILPSSVFAQHTNSEKGIVIEINLESAPDKPLKAIIGCDIPDDYTSPRNIHYKITGKVEKSVILLDVLPEEWTLENISGNSGNKKLNVERLSVSVNQLQTTRIHFWSNQPQVIIDDVCYGGYSGSSEFSLSDFFIDLSGTGANNMHYNSSSGSGYLDIAIKDIPNILNTIPDVLRINLNASGLKREIILLVEK